MKKLLALLLMCTSVISLANCVKSCEQSNKERKVLRIGTNANFPPFETIDQQGGLIGFDIDFGRALAAELGLKPEFKEFDFDALILALKKGQIDIILSGMSITKSRQEEIDMVPYLGKPITDVALVFWKDVPSHLLTIEDVKKLSHDKKLPVNVQAGHFLEGFLREQNVNVKLLPGPPEQILDIKYNKSLAAALDNSNAKSLMSTHSDLKVLILPLPEDKWDLGAGIGIKKNNTELLNNIREAVAKLRENGLINSLEKKWMGNAS